MHVYMLHPDAHFSLPSLHGAPTLCMWAKSFRLSSFCKSCFSVPSCFSQCFKWRWKINPINVQERWQQNSKYMQNCDTLATDIHQQTSAFFFCLFFFVNWMCSCKSRCTWWIHDFEFVKYAAGGYCTPRGTDHPALLLTVKIHCPKRHLKLRWCSVNVRCTCCVWTCVKKKKDSEMHKEHIFSIYFAAKRVQWQTQE